MYGYIYKTTNIINNKIYIGKKKGEFDNNYKGSGKALKLALKKYGKENFSVEILEFCNSLQEQNEKEKYWINYYKQLKYKLYNIAPGGDGGNIYEYLPEEQLNEIKNKLSILNKNGICGNKGKHLSPEHKKKIGLANKNKKRTPEMIERHRQLILGKPAWNKGLTIDDERVKKYARKKGTFHHTEETKALLSIKCSGRTHKVSDETKKKISRNAKNKAKSKEHKIKIGLAMKNKIWIHKGELTKMINKEKLNDYLLNGFELGRGKVGRK